VNCTLCGECTVAGSDIDRIRWRAANPDAETESNIPRYFRNITHIEPIPDYFIFEIEVCRGWVVVFG